MSREHNVCCVASWAERDADSEQGGGAVAWEGTVVRVLWSPRGKGWVRPSSLCPGWGLQHPWEQPKDPDDPDVFFHRPWGKRDRTNVQLEELSSSTFSG